MPSPAPSLLRAGPAFYTGRVKSKNHLPAVDAYIAESQPFAQPILTHLRKLVHQAVPDAEEAIKWRMPFFLKGGVFLANMAAFKGHCAFGIWGEEIAAKLKEEGRYSKEAMGMLGKITALADLPGDEQLLAYLRAGAEVISSGKRTKSYSRPKPSAKPELPAPAELSAALKKNKAAQKKFDAFSPSHRREYIEWIVEAKRDETRAKRVAQAIEWLAKGKHRNWKYE
jgi:uncharacterized protein YdeI (YjbR/CyaY-like superfamily)